MSEEVKTTPIEPELPPAEKPKRVLTEAQRLAFLKGREKRMLNIEMKKQQQQVFTPPAIDQDEFAEKVANLIMQRMPKKPDTPPTTPKKQKPEKIQPPTPEKPKLAKQAPANHFSWL